MVPRLAPMIDDTVHLVHEALDAQQWVLFEGAQATYLDLDHGTYPFVTSSNPIAGGVCTGAGVGPLAIQRVVGVVKAYTDRGSAAGRSRPSCSKATRSATCSSIAAPSSARTPSRRRRTGWLDLVMLKHAVRLNTCTELAITKLDVLSPLQELKVCVAYEGDDGTRYDHVPYHQSVLHKVRPVYETLPGWGDEIERAGPARGAAPRGARLRAVHRGVRRRAREHRRRRSRARPDHRAAPRRVRVSTRRSSSSARGGRVSTRCRVGDLRALAARRRGACRAPGQSRHGAARRVLPVAACGPDGGGRARRRRSTPISSSSVPRTRWSRASSTRCEAGGHLAFGRTRRGRPPRGVEGVDEGRARRRGRADRRARARSARRRGSAAFAFLDTLPGLYVVKTDGLAAGKGVVVTESLADARDAVRAYLSGEAFGDAGRTLRDRGGADRPRAVAVRAVRRQRRVAARVGAGPQARRSTATRARTPVAWARTRPCRSCRRTSSTR